jgi:transposase-like protein
MEYSIDKLLDEQKCYDHLLNYIHGGHLNCSCCGSNEYRVHQRRRKPVLQYKCQDCGTYFNVYSGTAFQGTHWPCSKVVMILRGIVKGDSTLNISKELGLGYRNLLYLRHELMSNGFDNREQAILEDEATESDEMYQNSGEKGLLHPNPEDPPRCRANKKKGMALGQMTAPRSMVQ